MRAEVARRVAGLGRGAALAGLSLLAACADTSASTAPATATAAAARAAAVSCRDLSFPIYFQFNSDQLTVEAKQVIAGSAARVRGCRLGALDVVGLADSRLSKGKAQALSERRAVVVADTMKAAGLPAPNFELAAFGKEGARTKRGVQELLRHRADVTIHAAPPPATPAAAAATASVPG